MLKFSSKLNIVLVLTLLTLTPFYGVTPSVGLAATEGATPNPDWQDTGLVLPDALSKYASGLNVCFDATHPGRVSVSGGSAGAVAYDWQNGKQVAQYSHPFTLCDEYTGQLYGRQGKGAVRFSLDHPDPQSISYMPDALAGDGSGAVYTFTRNDTDQLFNDNRLYFSPDGGQTWLDRGQSFRGKRIEATSVAPGYAGVVYAAVVEKDEPALPGSMAGTKTYSIYYSDDGGQSWEKRWGHTNTSDTTLTLNAGINPLAPINYVILGELGPYYGGHSSYNDNYWLSTDGAKTIPTDTIRHFSGDAGGHIDTGPVYYTPSGLVNLEGGRRYDPNAFIRISQDNGKTWQSNPAPFNPIIPSDGYCCDQQAELVQIRYAPTNFFMRNLDGSGDLWYSPNGARSWQKLTRNMERLAITPYAPRTVLGFSNGKIYRLSLPQADTSLTNSVAASGVPNSLYFAPTGHNLPGLFKNYWEQHGGLAQFGYPRTEPFLEVNPSDGKVYSVQYFERNRFEYHPDYAGTPYEVELGLLGNQLTTSRHAAGEAPFQRAVVKQEPGNTYFNETGHNLQGVFKQYWEQHGGLSLYGYPISEVFDEVNPDDGQHYQVQYFERNRFEYHPNNPDPKYKVLLGLLGNTLLKGKGWL